MGVTVAAHIRSIENVHDDPFDPALVDEAQLRALLQKPFPVLRDSAAGEMEQAILRAKAECDSVGGIIECAAVGLLAGWGDPMFGGLENRIAQIIFGVPAVRGLEFGTGFAAAQMRGSAHNDPYYVNPEGAIRTRTNHHGGILGGISSGMPLVFRLAVKPTPSIARAQESVSLSRVQDETLEIRGRHDPCIVPRAVPVVEAAAAAAIYDAARCAQ